MRGWFRVLQAGLVTAILSGCASTMPNAPGQPSAPVAQDLPKMRMFGAARPMAPQRSNQELARDFLDLSFKLESGAELARFTRFETPVVVTLTGQHTAVFGHELDRLLRRIRAEAGLSITRGSNGTRGQITVEAISRTQMHRLVPNAACFVVPVAITWEEFRRGDRWKEMKWTTLSTRTAATVFVPYDTSPQEIRDCLHEEIAQALGPLNDLYRLEDSIFNDDNMHSVLTGFDMLMLRATYDPRLASGMGRAQAEAQISTIMSSINPAGNRFSTRPYQPSSRAWVDAIEGALSAGRRSGGRRSEARKALEIAQSKGWQDTRLGLSYLTVGQLTPARDSEASLEAFMAATQVYNQRAATAIHAANVGIQISAFALASGDLDAVLRLTDHHIPAAKRAEDAALLADLLLVRAAALRSLGRVSEAQAVRSEALGWGRYGLRSGQAVLSREAEINALAPQRSGT